MTANRDPLLCQWGTRDTCRALYLAGGGDPAAFDDLWALNAAWRLRTFEDIDQGRHVFTGGLILYAAWGRKPLG
jgi:hypothetical protein